MSLLLWRALSETYVIHYWRRFIEKIQRLVICSVPKLRCILVAPDLFSRTLSTAGVCRASKSSFVAEQSPMTSTSTVFSLTTTDTGGDRTAMTLSCSESPLADTWSPPALVEDSREHGATRWSFADPAMLNDCRVLDSLLVLDDQHLPSLSYFQYTQPDLQPYMRRMVVTWMMEVLSCRSWTFLSFAIAFVWPKIRPDPSGLRLSSSGGSKNFEKGGRKTIYQLRLHLSQMRTTKYMLLHRKSGFKNEPIGGGGRPPTLPPPLSPPLLSSTINSNHIPNLYTDQTGF